MSAHKHPNGLTLKQEAFVGLYLTTGNASEAYRGAYNAGRMKDETIWVKACELVKSGKVAGRIAELQAEMAEKALITVEGQTDAHQRLARKAEDAGDHAVAGKEHERTEKLLGMLTDKVEHSGSAIFEMHIGRPVVKPALVGHEQGDE